MEWEVRRENPHDPDSWEYEVISPSGTGRSHYRIAGSMNKPNAQLLASAPKQNEALKEIDQWLIENMVDYVDDGTLHCIHCHIQNALAKAASK